MRNSPLRPRSTWDTVVWDTPRLWAMSFIRTVIGARLGSLGREREDLDVAERDLVAVVLEQDVALELRAPPGLVLELAPGLGGHQGFALQLVLQHLPAVQP